jgi:hypothetical protein
VILRPISPNQPNDLAGFAHTNQTTWQGSPTGSRDRLHRSYATIVGLPATLVKN